VRIGSRTAGCVYAVASTGILLIAVADAGHGDYRYHGVFAPNHPLRQAVTGMAIGNVGEQREAADRTDRTDEKQCSHDTSRIAWAKLLARVGEEFPLACPRYGGDIRLISFITQPETIRRILTHLGELLDPPQVSPARGPLVDWGELLQSFGAGPFEQLSPDDLPMIDIHHRLQPVPHPSRRTVLLPH
jgi:hypothetical protein